MNKNMAKSERGAETARILFFIAWLNKLRKI